MTGAIIGPDEGTDGIGLLPAGAPGAGALVAGCWLPHPAIHAAQTSTTYAGSERFESGVKFMTLSDEPALARRSK
jgi:hypothetical protein